jgi:hypothetical protein
MGGVWPVKTETEAWVLVSHRHSEASSESDARVKRNGVHCIRVAIELRDLCTPAAACPRPTDQWSCRRQVLFGVEKEEEEEKKEEEVTVTTVWGHGGGGFCLEEQEEVRISRARGQLG